MYGLALGVAVAYELAFSVVLFDGMSTEQMDGGNKAAYGFLFLPATPACAVASLVVCFWLRHRFGRLSLLLPLIPVAVWAVVLVARFATGNCGNALSRC